MILAAALVLSLVSGSTEPSALSRARDAYAAGDFQKAAPLLDVALSGPLTSSEAAHAYGMKAIVDAAFGRTSQAISSLRHALGVTPDFALPAEEQGPKIQGLLMEAKKQGPLPGPHAGVQPTPTSSPALTAALRSGSSDPAVTVSPPFYRSWWFWTAAGVVAVGAGATFGLQAARRPIPLGNLGSEQL